MKTVWIYVDTSKKVGDVDHLKVFANIGAANRWLEQNDPAGVAVRYEVRTAAAVPEIRAPSGKKTIVSNGDLTTIFFPAMRSYPEHPSSGTPIRDSRRRLVHSGRCVGGSIGSCCIARLWRRSRSSSNPHRDPGVRRFVAGP